MTSPDYSPAADRNKQAILEVLLTVLPERGNALEIASGTGQHVAWFASSLPGWTWQPSDAQPDGFESINVWVIEQGVRNVRSPVVIDVMASNWLPTPQLFDLIYCANMLHIAPWATCAALMRGSAQHLGLADGWSPMAPILKMAYLHHRATCHLTNACASATRPGAFAVLKMWPWKRRKPV